MQSSTIGGRTTDETVRADLAVWVGVELTAVYL